MIRFKSFAVAAVALLWLFAATLAGCRRDEDYVAEAGAQPLSFSCDTMAFDTVFVSLGTTTRQMRVYNRNDSPVMISSVTLREGRNSCFRLNVDGDSSLVARDIRLEANDSLFIFIQATIDPNNLGSLFLVEDEILFDVKGCGRQRLPLTAYGRNAVYHVPTDTLKDSDGVPLIDRYGNPYAYSVIDCDNWNHDLAHVVVGYAVVDSASTLTLIAGDELYFAADAVLWIYNGGTLVAQGSDETPVLFTSLRQDSWYRELPGQWGHIWLGGVSGGSSKDCFLDHVRIENAYYGVIADSNDYGQPTLTISNSEIAHIKGAALQADEAWVVGDHLLLYDCGGATIYAPFGGRYHFSNVTSANYWVYDHRSTPSVILANWYESVSGVVLRDLHEAVFTDCIIYGNRGEGEVLLDGKEGAAFGVSFENCIVKGGTWDVNPQFVDVGKNDYRLQDDSPAQRIGYYADYREAE